MPRYISKYKNVICQAIPSLLAICIVELVNVEVYLFGPVSQNATMLFIWIALQLIPGFVFGYISDCNFRKATLIVCQLLGLIGGLTLLVFGFETWVLILIALTFNPLPVARAALLDHFPQHSTVKLVAITFLAQYLPWTFFGPIANYPHRLMIFIILGLLGLNTLLTAFLFKGDTEKLKKKPEANKIKVVFKNKTFIYSLTAFVFAEATFYLFWAFLEYNPDGHAWITITNYSTVLGIGIAMLYTRLPHISIITLLYSIGAGIAIIALAHCSFVPSFCGTGLINAMSTYAIIGGLYLPFVTDGVIRMVGTRHRAFGSATIEFGDTIASFVAPLLNIFFIGSSHIILITTVILYIFAALLQRKAENSIATSS
ncbi:MAG: hypothetical protein K2X08_04160 [Chlamydiales bacterium]|nr:hypothetical protein [Chlamydiales bacterium]MBY0529924.1 hypothetical protein [Rhabdochlamydiaceae bacterium]